MIRTTVSPQISKAMATATDRHNQNRQTILSVFHKAIQIIKDTPQWPSGHAVTVFSGQLRGRNAEIYIKNEGGWLTLNLYRSGASLMDRYYSKPFTVGVLEGNWKLSANATEANYLSWNRQVRRELERQGKCGSSAQF